MFHIRNMFIADIDLNIVWVTNLWENIMRKSINADKTVCEENQKENTALNILTTCVLIALDTYLYTI